MVCHPHISQDLQRRGRGGICHLTTAKRSHSCAQGIGVCEIARRLRRAGVNGSKGIAPQCGDAERQLRLSRNDGSMAC